MSDRQSEGEVRFAPSDLEMLNPWTIEGVTRRTYRMSTTWCSMKPSRRPSGS